MLYYWKIVHVTDYNQILSAEIINNEMSYEIKLSEEYNDV